MSSTSSAGNSFMFLSLFFTSSEVFVNRAYPENTNFKTCAPSTLNFYTFCGLQKIKNC